jgi:hypothetical protein
MVRLSPPPLRGRGYPDSFAGRVGPHRRSAEVDGPTPSRAVPARIVVRTSAGQVRHAACRIALRAAILAERTTAASGRNASVAI